MAAPAVEIEQYSVRFGEFQALQEVSLEVPEGAFVAMVGPNGAGKSTLLKALLGLERGSMRDGPTRVTGRIRVFGHPPREVPPGWVGYVPQVKGFDRSFPALAIEVVVSGLRRHWPFRIGREERRQASEVLEKVGALHLASRRLGGLSGGELQRVYLARSLIRQPRLLLLDEPATGVDVVGEADLYRHLEAYQAERGATILMITHDWEAAQHHASAVLVLNRRVVGYGPPEKVLCHECLSQAFGHVGHAHQVVLGGR
ncbi:metal ABC transporter ATP-binding protein [Meiothermus ruber]|jgi:zinc transport system ATP-binding protein|uniref:ABC transporter n=1 Tax=Meiothermus ruber (strain ATCC 35948 / DSM 1279 / VKM B-1258 / 21) TaxID=504728 RepID=D3PSC5_MEIRD|nr:ABC transporter ATP-binding protein [Meiothermus ruber]GIW39095.1 MAG: ABC transporter ATP-binding protein [Meiothermus sp.]ADD28358.1 ABC transporter related protein [Meiothermus ruber DSM 1279]AGK06202.1 ABC transporter [Meiothermus ruber DSM 1279]MCL6529038.1 ABC transporter ATP-binding protein [Meiothermus ruber]GAO75313.1 ABC transporter [Meiothermus ruber H328]